MKKATDLLVIFFFFLKGKLALAMLILAAHAVVRTYSSAYVSRIVENIQTGQALKNVLMLANM